MSDWGEGYVTTTDYTTSFFDTLAPSTLDTVAFFLSKRPARRGSQFRYFELGCGTGLTSILLAAMNPEAQFAANDFNPGHVAIANDIIEALGLTNITITDSSFADALAEQHEPYDYIVSHGVYTWVSQENRDLLVEFIGKNLKVGGYALLSYNCAAGWSPHDFLNVLFKSLLQGRDTTNPGLSREIVQQIDELFNLEEGHFTAEGPTKKFMEALNLGKHDPRYVMHEFGNEAWEPVYSHDAIEHMASQKLNFIGQSSPLHNLPLTGIPENTRGVLEGRPMLQREMLVDLAMKRSFRSDVFVKGAIDKTPGVRRADFDATRFFTKFSIDLCRNTIDVPTGEITLDENACSQILAYIGAAGCNGRELREHCVGHGIDEHELFEFMCILCGVDYVLIEADPPAPFEAVDGVNRRLCAMALDGLRSINYLMSPRTRSALLVTLFDQLFFHIGETSSQARLCEQALAEIKTRQIGINGSDGEPLAGQALEDLVFSQAETYLNQTLAVLRALHIAAADDQVAEQKLAQV
ncbi:MAG: class I SAM-dependent methyltransferase [Pseudomonadota bacterium]